MMGFMVRQIIHSLVFPFWYLPEYGGLKIASNLAVRCDEIFPLSFGLKPHLTRALNCWREMAGVSIANLSGSRKF